MGELDNSAAVAVTGKIMVIAIIILFMVVVFVLFLHLYAKWFWWRMEQPPPRRRRRRFVFTPGQDPVRRGLDLSVLRQLPLVIFQSEDFEDGLECAVCLSEVEQEEKIRLLPKCNHGFHVDCIDMWFQSHSTCPLCRSSVVAITQPCNSTGNNELEMSIQSQDERLASGNPTECPNFPTNVLFWGDQTQMSTGVGSLEEGSSSSSPALPTSYSAGIRHHQTLVIDIPEQMSENFGEGQDSKTPTPTPTSTRLRSLKRLLSREKRVSPTCSGGSAEV